MRWWTSIKAPLPTFPGPLFKLRSATRIELLSSRNRSEVVPELTSKEMTYNYVPAGVPPHILELKVGIPVMMIRNVLHPHLVNGKMYVVKRVTPGLLLLSTTPGDRPSSKKFVVHRIDVQFEFSDIKVLRRQFPVRLALSATVHKAQGITFSRLVVDLRTNFLAPGQLYLALART